MQKTIRLVATLALAAFLAACGAKTVEEHLLAAEADLAAGDTNSAVIELKNALQKDGKSPEGRWLLGKLYLDSGEMLSAEKELQLAHDLGWPRSDVLPALAETYLAQGKFEELRALDSKNLQGDDARVHLLALKSLAAQAMGDIEKASEHLNKALETDPESPKALLAKARLLAGQQDLVEAHEILDILLDHDPDNAQAWGLAGDIRSVRGQFDEALAAYNQSLSIQPENFGTLLRRGLLALQMQDTALAERDAAQMIKLSALHPVSNYLQGLIDFQAQRYEKAISALSAAEPLARQFPLTLFFLGSAQLIQGQLDQAGSLASRFHALVPGSNEGRILLATIRLRQGQHQAVPELLQPVLDVSPDNVEVLNLMSNALLADGKTDEGLAMLARVAELQPDSPVAQVRLGAGLLLTGKESDGSKRLETALELNPEFQQAEILLIMNHVRKNDFDAAIKAAKNYRLRHFSSTTPLNILGRVYQAAGQHDEAKTAFEKALQMTPGDPGANHSLAQIALAAGESEVARSYYDTVLEHNENYLPVLLQLVKLDVREQRWAEVESRLDQAIEAHPQTLEPRLMLGRYHLSQNRPEKVGAVFASLQDETKRAPRVLHLMALAQLAARDNSQAQFTLGQLAQAVPDSAAVHHLMARAAAGLGDSEQAEESLRKALELNPDHLMSRIGLARYLFSNRNMAEFDEHLSHLTKRAPEHPDVLMLRAQKSMTDDDIDAALELAQRAYSTAPTVKTLGTLGSLIEAKGDAEAARALYNDWVKTHPNDVQVRMKLANDLQLEGNTDAAVGHYRRILTTDRNNIIALNNLAWHLKETEPENALVYARRASEIMSDSAEVLDTLAVIEFLNKDYPQAERTIERALDLDPEHPSARYHQAMIASAYGNTDKAIRVLEALAAEQLEFPERQQANTLLESLR